ncbi:MAG TPA: type 4a pilus biogenesis protein PilO [Terriglobales bacterium]|nr:type 4a pilus biogenesis protein PilO [Terriglobales bacterium]
MAMPAIFAPIANAPRPHKIILGVMGLAAIVGAAYFLLLAPLAATVQTLTAENDRVQKELVQARAIAADVARFRREIAALEQTLNALTARLPNERETPPLYRAVSDAAFQSGLAVALFQPRDAQIKDYYAEIPITLTAEGSYHQFGTFFERVARLPRVVNVGDLRMTGTQGATAPAAKDPKAGAVGPVRGELILATYMYRPVGSPPAPKPGQPGTKPAGAK